MKVGSYEILEEISRGDGAFLFKARAEGGSVIALKLLARTFTDEERARLARDRERFAPFGEAEGFVSIIEVGEAPQGPYVVTPLVEGGTLRDRLAPGPLAIDAAIDLAQALATTLGRIHARGIVHGGLRPESIHLTVDGRVLVSDLGLAPKGIGSAEETPGLVLGGDRGGGYAAPEVLEDPESASPASDVFSAGAILYECVAGRPAFRGSTSMDVVLAVLAGTVPPLTVVRAETPPWLGEIVGRALSTEAADRFPEGTSLARALAERDPGKRPVRAPRRASGPASAPTPEPADLRAARSNPGQAFGPYLLLEELGRGGMGVVHRAFHERLHRFVAVKMLHPSGENDAAMIQRLEREGRAIARLRHPNIVSVHEVGEIAGRHFLAMDLVDGTTLDRLLAARGSERLAPTKAIEVVRDVARAVHAAHEQGVIHRDLKPGNIMLDRSGRAHVMDFGLARVAGAETKLTETGASVGTPAYMPPEQVAGREGAVDRRSDVYSLGATLYHVIAGRAPFEAPTSYGIVHSLLTDEPTPPGSINRRAAGELETVCLRCLEKEPARRYPTAAALADDLDRYLAGEPITSRPVSAFERLRRRVRRNKLVAALALAALASLVSLGVATVRNAVERQQAQVETMVRLGRQLARAFAERSRREVDAGRFREAATYAAEAIARDDVPEYRVALLEAQQGPWRKPRRVEGFKGYVNDLVFSRRAPVVLASCADDGTLRLCDPTTGSVTSVVSAHAAPVRHLALAPGEDRLASAADDGAVRVWSFPALAPLATITLGEKATAVAWSSDGMSLAIGSLHGPQAIRIYQLRGQGPELVRSIEWRETILSLSWSPDGHDLAFGSFDNRVGVCSLETGAVATLAGHAAFVGAVAWSPDGRALASASCDRTARIWNPATRRELVALRGHTDIVAGIAWSPDGERIATASEDRSCRIWNAATGLPVASLRLEENGPGLCVAWSPDGATLASGNSNAMTLWDVAVDRLSTPSPLRYAWYVAALDGEGRRVVAGHLDDEHGDPRTRLVLREVPGGAEIAHLEVAGRDPALTAVALSGRGDRVGLLSVDGAVSVWETTRDAPVLLGRHDAATLLGFSSGGRWLVSVSRDHDAKLWDVEGHRELATLGHRVLVDALAWEPGGSRFVTLSGDELKLWQAPDGRLLARLASDGEVYGLVAWSPAQQRIAVGSGTGFDLWTPLSSRVVPVVVDRDRVHWLTALAWSPSGRHLAMGSNDRKVKLWDMGPAREVVALPAQRGAARALAFRRDGKTLVVACDDETVKSWPLDEILDRGRPPGTVLAETEEGTGLSVDPRTLEAGPTPVR